ncbi:hypothetical protein PFLCHA0_c36200 [Pseudomonas protegens CHA0]|uniref:Uncharacterized protein n=1 Tax=Pseudomonas protegens (strain DSM 19095 / LMG 27888 / CFBP 6595 / CHA0) TaxID=1124983 RepID=A0A2C9EP17_PSEPH|nr:hypothetical protein PFLCHA0_c36200 [Pseudomonas protegens CHA0]
MGAIHVEGVLGGAVLRGDATGSRTRKVAWTCGAYSNGWIVGVFGAHIFTRFCGG